jgi:hypothetical protein
LIELPRYLRTLREYLVIKFEGCKHLLFARLQNSANTAPAAYLALVCPILSCWQELLR